MPKRFITLPRQIISRDAPTLPNETIFMSDKESIPYKILDDVTGDVKYAYAYNGNSARNFITRNRFTVTRLSIKEALSLKPEDILDATQT